MTPDARDGHYFFWSVFQLRLLRKAVSSDRNCNKSPISAMPENLILLRCDLPHPSWGNIEAFNKEYCKCRSLSPGVKFLLIALCFFLLNLPVFSQQEVAPEKTVDSLKTQYDSALNKLFSTVRKFGAEEQKKNINEYNEGAIARKQDGLIEEIRKLTLEAKNFLENGLDTSGLSIELEKIEGWYKITSDGVFINPGTVQTHRNLETSYEIMRELVARTVAKKSALDVFYKNLAGYKHRIDSLYKDSVLYTFSSDTTVLRRYLKNLIIVSHEVRPNDSALKKTMTTVSELQPAWVGLINKLTTGLEQIEIFQDQLSGKTFNREMSNIGGHVLYSRSLDEIIYFSMRKTFLVLAFYTEHESGKVILLLILVLAATVFIASLKQRMRKQNLLNNKLQEELVLRFPLISGIVIVLNLFQFIFIDPPFIFNALLWTISALCLSFIMRPFVTRYWMIVWVILIVFFLLASADNLILQASRTERWLTLGLSVTGIVAGSLIFFTGRRQELKEKLVFYFLGFVIFLQIISASSNIYGRYNLHKTSLTGGFFNIILAVLFFWTLRLINQLLSLASESYKVPGKKLFNINFDRVGSKVPAIFYVFLFIGWFILFARNFYLFKVIADPIKDLFLQKRTIGEFSFSIGQIFEFFLILYLSGLTSRIVSFFATPEEYESEERKRGLGSWLLIIRIAIITTGLLFAFAAMGIPMDRLTIILSALSVGIGFGLQSLVNNLVSGLIISFEKPVNVGDIVEVGGQTGTINSIGFRSSIISTSEGAEVVIPNGVLLNQNLVNWTHNNSHRSVDIPLSLPTGTNLQEVIQILRNLPKNDDRVLLIPEPNVILKQIDNNSIDIELSFWVKNIREWTEVKSDILLAIESELRQYKIMKS
jgi:potassium efflux system protein